MLKHFCNVVAAITLPVMAIASTTRIQSPDGSIEMSVNLNDSISYSVAKDGKIIIERINIALSPEGAHTIGVNPRLKKVKDRKSVV